MRPMSCATSWESEYRRTVSTSSAYTEEQRRCCLGHISYIRRQKAQRYGEYGWRQKCGAAAAGSYAMLGILEAAGCRTDFNGGRVRVCPGISEEAFLHEDLVRELRSSVFLLGPMLALKRSVHMGFPGGCDIGKRPVDIHLEALRRMGAEIEEKDGKIVCTVKQLRGASVRLPFPSVGATENIMMAAAMAEGVTVIRNAAREPEIIELQDFLNAMGAEISDYHLRKETASRSGMDCHVRPD